MYTEDFGRSSFSTSGTQLVTGVLLFWCYFILFHGFTSLLLSELAFKIHQLCILCSQFRTHSILFISGKKQERNLQALSDCIPSWGCDRSPPQDWSVHQLHGTGHFFSAAVGLLGTGHFSCATSELLLMPAHSYGLHSSSNTSSFQG